MVSPLSPLKDQIAATFRAQELATREVRARMLVNHARLADEPLPPGEIEAAAQLRVLEAKQAREEERFAEELDRRNKQQMLDIENALRLYWRHTPFFFRLVHTIKGTLP
tara:strand:- start:114 stop:440 length:327 start_codon:yes stop_codon:yes gene_type:complete